MKREDLDTFNLPDSPGVYFFRGTSGKILYIGKATSLRDRVRSYFSRDLAEDRGAHIEKMVHEAQKISYEETSSVLEALVLEAKYIKKHLPHYNSDQKDDKSYNSVVVTKEDFPRVVLIRGKEKEEYDAKKTWPYEVDTLYGPFPHGLQLREALKIIRKIIPYRDTCTPLSGKPCFHAQIGLCPGVCAGTISKRDYKKNIRNIKLFFQGRTNDVRANLTKQMNQYADDLRFEKAQELKRSIFALDHIQDVSLLKKSTPQGKGERIEAYDIAHISGKHSVGVMVVVKDGYPYKAAYRKFKIKSFSGADDTRALKEVLTRRLEHTEWEYPRIIITDGGKAQKNTAEKLLKEAGISIPVVSVVKDDRHRPRQILGSSKVILKHEREILLANAEAHRFAVSYHRNIREKIR